MYRNQTLKYDGRMIHSPCETPLDIPGDCISSTFIPKYWGDLPNDSYYIRVVEFDDNAITLTNPSTKNFYRHDSLRGPVSRSDRFVKIKGRIYARDCCGRQRGVQAVMNAFRLESNITFQNRGFFPLEWEGNCVVADEIPYQDVAQNLGTVTVSSDAGQPGTNTVDGNPATFWRPGSSEWVGNGGSPTWMVDLGQEITVDQFQITWADWFGWLNRASDDIDVEYSLDGISWTTIVASFDGTYSQNVGAFFAPTKARYWRMKFAPFSNVGASVVAPVPTAIRLFGESLVQYEKYRAFAQVYEQKPQITFGDDCQCTDFEVTLVMKDGYRFIGTGSQLSLIEEGFIGGYDLGNPDYVFGQNGLNDVFNPTQVQIDSCYLDDRIPLCLEIKTTGAIPPIALPPHPPGYFVPNNTAAIGPIIFANIDTGEAMVIHTGMQNGDVIKIDGLNGVVTKNGTDISSLLDIRFNDFPTLGSGTNNFVLHDSTHYVSYGKQIEGCLTYSLIG